MKKRKFSMKSLTAFLSTIAISSIIILACNKSDTAPFTPISQHGQPQALLGGFECKYISLNGGSKGDCSEPGNNCKCKSSGSIFTSEQQEQLSILNGCITNNNIVHYFAIGDWAILFPELEQHDVNQILDGSLFFYQTENNAEPNSYIYVLSNTATKADISTDNTLAAWVY
jgi:hypothetical protein